MKILDYIFFGRPMLLLPVWTVYFHASAQLFNTNRLSVTFSIADAVYLVSLSLVFMGTYIINQIFDIESDRINNKLFFLPRKIISLHSAWVYYVILSSIGIGLAALFNIYAGIAASLVGILGLLYSVPGVCLKDRPVLGLLANAVAYGLLVPGIHGILTVIGESVFVVLPYFFAIATGYILTTIPDREGDRHAEKKTVAVILGYRPSLLLAGLTSLLTVLTAIFAENYDMIAISGITIMLIVWLYYRPHERLLLFACKFPILLLTLAGCLYFPPYLIFLLLTTFITRVYYKNRFGITYPNMS